MLSSSTPLVHDQQQENMLDHDENLIEPLTPKLVTGRNGSYLRVMEFRGRSFFPNFFEYRVKEQTVRDDDVYLVSYPKSGTHWVYNIVNMLLKGTVTYSPSEMFLGFTCLETIESSPSPRLFATHVPYFWLPQGVQKNQKVRIINLYRNPKDTCVSYYHFVKTCQYFKGEWNDFFEIFTTKGEDICEGSWFTSFKSWEQVRKDNPHILLIKYEDLKTGFRKQLLRLSNFLGLSYNQDFYDEMENVCQFEKMRDATKPKDWWPKQDTNPVLRKGEIGDWKNYFTMTQNETFDALYRNEMKDSMEEFKFY